MHDEKVIMIFANCVDETLELEMKKHITEHQDFSTFLLWRFSVL